MKKNLERPFDYFTKIFFENIEKANDNFIFNFNHTDKILVWIVGFSIAGLSLIVSSLSELEKSYNQLSIRTILILLVLIIIFGIGHRLAFLHTLKIHQNIIFFLKGAFTEKRMTLTEFEPISNPNNIYEIVQKIYDGFGLDYSDNIELYNNSESEGEKNRYTEYCLAEYKRLINLSKSEYDFSLTYIKDILKQAYGFSDETANSIFEKDESGLSFTTWNNICTFLSSMTIILFILVLIILVSNY